MVWGYAFVSGTAPGQVTPRPSVEFAPQLEAEHPTRPLRTLTPRLLPQGAGFAGFLWDSAAGVELRDAAWQESSPGNGHGKPVGPSPYLARFKVSPLLPCGATPSEKEKSPL